MADSNMKRLFAELFKDAIADELDALVDFIGAEFNVKDVFADEEIAKYANGAFRPEEIFDIDELRDAVERIDAGE